MTLEVDLDYLYEDKDRHGNARVYCRYQGRKRRIREPKGTAEFSKAFSAALEELRGGAPDGDGAGKSGYRKNSIGWLAAQYFGSVEFKALDPRSQQNRRDVIEACLEEPLKPGSKFKLRDCPYQSVTVAHIQMVRDRKAHAGLPGAANNRRKYLGSMFGWAIEQKKFKITSNPCRDTRRVKYVSEGFHPWTIQEVTTYIERHPPGTMAYLALCLLLFLGSRKEDAIRLGPKHMRTIVSTDANGAKGEQRVMAYVPKKTSYKRVEESVKPILLPLAEALRITPHGLETFLVTAYGKPFTDDGFTGRMRDWCDEAGLPECTSHGLKKVAASIAADMGATDRQMMALFDWVTERMANVYTTRANKGRLASEAAKLLGSFFTQQPIAGMAQAG